jgi:hypothetical protein
MNLGNLSQAQPNPIGTVLITPSPSHLKLPIQNLKYTHNMPLAPFHRPGLQDFHLGAEQVLFLLELEVVDGRLAAHREHFADAAVRGRGAGQRGGGA